MKNFLNRVQDERSFAALTGLDRPAFDNLLKEFSSCFKRRLRQKAGKSHQRRTGGGRKSILGSIENQLFFILFYLKSYPTFDVLAFTFEISLGCAAESVHRLLPILERAQKNLSVLPKRPSDKPNALKELIEKQGSIIIDATERPHFRPKNKDAQKKFYSGKKHRHTVKNTIISDAQKRILVVGETVPGAQHDYSLFKKEFDPKNEFFGSTVVAVDLGYQGIKKDYGFPENIRIPHKKPRKSRNNPDLNLTPAQRQENREMSRTRVVVEHAIGGMKIFRVLTSCLRNKVSTFSDKVIVVASGLWNLKNSFTVQ